VAAILFRPRLCAPHIRRVGAHERHGYWKLGSARDLDSNTAALLSAKSAVYWRAPANLPTVRLGNEIEADARNNLVFIKPSEICRVAS